MTWAILVVVLLVIIIAYVIYLTRLLRHQSRPLNINDHVGIANLIIGSVINITVLVVAIFSLMIAIKSYDSANKSGDEQLKALDAARRAIITSGTEQKESLDKSHNALDLVVKTVRTQQQILNKNLGAANAQLTIIQEQRQRELARPNIHARLVNPAHLSMSVTNISKNKVAREVNYELIVINLDRKEPNGYFAVHSTRTETMSSIAPGSGFLPTSLEFVGAVPNKGDRLFGYLSAGCPECEAQRLYWLYCKYGESGWYHEGTIGDYPYPIFRYTSNTANDILGKFHKHTKNAILDAY